MDACQFAVYQMKRTPAYRRLRFRPYKELQEEGAKISSRDYDQVYLGHMHPQETPEDIRHRLCGQLPRNFNGHSVSTGDVFVLNRAGVVVSYYVEKESFTVLAGFLHKDSALVSIETSNYHIEGKNGGWNAIDSVLVEGREFFLMEHDNYGSAGACVILDEQGKLAVDGVQNGFEQSVMRQIADYLHPQVHSTEAGAGENDGEKQLQAAVQTDTEKNPAVRKKPGKACGSRDKRKPKKRASVLEKLRRKQAEIAERSRQAAQ